MEGSEQRRMSRKIPKSHERNSKDVKRKDNGDAHSGGGIGTILLRLKENQRTIGVDASIQLITKCALLTSARNVLEM